VSDDTSRKLQMCFLQGYAAGGCVMYSAWNPKDNYDMVCKFFIVLLLQPTQCNIESSNHHTFCTFAHFRFGAGKSSVFCKSIDIKEKKIHIHFLCTLEEDN
jgi:hypothetical protein